MKITALRQAKRNRDRVNIFLDGEYGFSLQKITAAYLRLGQELSEGEIERLKKKDGYEYAYQRVLNWIARRPRTEGEIRTYVRKFELSEEQVDRMLARLKEIGMVDDASYAQAWVESRQVSKPSSTRRLTFELRRKGVDEETIQQAVAENDEEQSARRLAAKKARQLLGRGLEARLFKNKLYQHLASRGFNYDIISKITAEIMQEYFGDDVDNYSN